MTGFILSTSAFAAEKLGADAFDGVFAVDPLLSASST